MSGDAVTWKALPQERRPFRWTEASRTARKPEPSTLQQRDRRDVLDGRLHSETRRICRTSMDQVGLRTTLSLPVPFQRWLTHHEETVRHRIPFRTLLRGERIVLR